MDSDFERFVIEQFSKLQDFQKFVIEQFNGVDGRLSSIENRLESIEITLAPLAVAFDKDSQTLVKHGRRISHIEKHLGC